MTSTDVVPGENYLQQFVGAVTALEGDISQQKVSEAFRASRRTFSALYRDAVCGKGGLAQPHTLDSFESALTQCDAAFTGVESNQYVEEYKGYVQRYLRYLCVFRVNGLGGVHQAIQQDLQRATQEKR